MPVIYDAAVKTARMTATRDHLKNGTLELQAANDDVLAIFTLSSTGGSVSGAEWTVAFVASSVVGEATAGGGTTATKARFKDSGGTVKISGLTVALSAADIILDNTSIAHNQTVTLSSAKITHAPDPV